MVERKSLRYGGDVSTTLWGPSVEWANRISRSDSSMSRGDAGNWAAGVGRGQACPHELMLKLSLDTPRE